MRVCTITKCKALNAWRCCADCEIGDCQARCKNHPDRCQCVKTEVEVSVEEMIKLAEAGLTNAAIGLRLGCSTDWVNKLLRRAGYRRTKPKTGGEENGK